MMAPCNRLEVLPVELLGELVRFLGPSASVALAMASASTRRDLFAAGYSPSSPWKFVDDCAKNGYFDLIKFAVKSGCAVDPHVLELAVTSAHVELAEWLLADDVDGPHLSSVLSDGDKMQLGILCISKGLVGLLMKYFWDPLHCNQYASSAARAGRSALAMKFYNPRVSLSVPLSSSAAEGGHLEAAKELLEISGDLESGRYSRQTQLDGIFKEGGRGGHLEICQWAVANGATIDYVHRFSSFEVCHNLEMLEFLHLHFPNGIRSALSFFGIMQFAFPSLHVLHYYLDKGYLEPSKETLKYAMFPRHHHLYDPYDGTLRKKAGEHRACIDVLIRRGASLEGIEFNRVPQWAHRDDVQWLLDHTIDNSRRDKFDVIRDYISLRMEVDTAILGNLIDHGYEMTEWAMRQVALVENAPEVYEFLFTQKEKQMGFFLGALKNQLIYTIVDITDNDIKSKSLILTIFERSKNMKFLSIYYYLKGI